MTALSKSSGYFVTQLEKLNGPIRTSHWSLNFNFNELINYENIIGLNYNVFTSDKLSLVTKDYQPPTVEMNSTTISYMGGCKKSVPTTIKQDDTLVVTMLETSDLICHKNILRWMQFCIYNYSYCIAAIGSDSAIFDSSNYNAILGYGTPIYKNKDDEVYGNFFVNNNTVYADVYDYTTGAVIMRVRYVNIYPVKISQPKLEQSTSNLYEFTVEFKFSRFVYAIPSPDPTTSTNSYTTESGSAWGRAGATSV